MFDIRDIQEKEIEMMHAIDIILKENNIHYWLLGGSVLGSIRHSGFIPWDDDIDIGVMRDDLPKVELLFSSLAYSYEATECHIIPDAPIGHLRYITGNYSIKNSPTIDMFALDRIPSMLFMQKLQRFFANIYHLCICRCSSKNRGIIAKLFTSIVLFITPNVVLNILRRISLKIIICWNSNNTLKIGNLFGAWGKKEIFETSMFSGITMGIFENMLLPLPMYPEKYLKQLYGNYMELPSIEKRIPKHIISE